MKKIFKALLSVTLFFVLTACESEPVEPDYTTTEAEAALNAGEDIVGKTVKITVDTYVPNGTLGYTIQTGEHLNFISPSNPDVKEGDELVVKVTEVTNVLGSFVMNYEKQ